MNKNESMAERSEAVGGRNAPRPHTKYSISGKAGMATSSSAGWGSDDPDRRREIERLGEIIRGIPEPRAVTTQDG